LKFLPTDLPGVILIDPDVHRDERGFFLEVHHERKYAEGGIDVRFVQDNHSQSPRGTLRGLHTQLVRPQGKLVRVIEGEVFDVAVDIRRGSPSFGRWTGAVLSADNFRQLYIPPNYAHGFCVTSESAQFEYKCTDFYDPSGEIAIAWNDPELAIDWPVREPLLSAKDREAPPLRTFWDRLPLYDADQ
jgi:dTDP-4-dehydrorhamnose 3,5-epimerase